MRRVTMVAFGLAASACVVGTDRPASRLDVARAPVDEPPAVSSTGTAARCTGERPAPPLRPTTDATWIDGFCHFDGARYAYVPGRWEPVEHAR
ncbi:MAG TPA: hypothetical protein VH062_25805 [Polyangiaceae bacterium]|jgi:hypothetical protein|nr:hypothetical protein [Polyangiaceae bacterium]